ncbi:MAG: hypothetical protein K0R26_1924 [Bacteroidota bacterium]|jgi:hypothetical protein|nr:hypothetical protein [Bacteroidota bacterium]
MIDFYFIIRWIRENLFALVILALMAAGLHFYWDRIIYLWEAERGKENFYHQYYK